MKRTALSVLVLSLPKSGSTAVFQAICEAFPKQPSNMERLVEVGLPQVVKGLICKQVFQSAAVVRSQQHKLPWFDKIVTLLRDPRDRLVSAMLYAAYNVVSSPTNPLATSLPAMVARKERMPSSVNCVDICRLMHGHATSMGSDLEYDGIMQLVQQSDRPVLKLRYEQLMADEGWDALTGFLGVPVLPPRTVTQFTQRVRRSARSGDWRHWFTPQDVERLKPLLSDMIERHGYDTDWTLASPQVLDPQYGSEFVRQCIALRLNTYSR